MKLSTGFIHSVRKAVGHSQDYAPYLTGALLSLRLRRAAVADSSQERKIGLGAVYAITASLLITCIPEATAKNYSVDHLKLYAHSRILDYKGCIVRSLRSDRLSNEDKRVSDSKSNDQEDER